MGLRHADSLILNEEWGLGAIPFKNFESNGRAIVIH
jgi:hypothetical protein